ncbi:MAG: putative DNA-binding domain-containing protein [Myxococcota bacterium]
MSEGPTAAEIARLRSLQRLLQDAIVTDRSREGLVADHRGGFAHRGDVRADDGAALREQPFTRLNVYRKLVRNTLRSAIGNELPKTRHRLGAERFERYYTSYLRTEAPASRLLRDVAYEFARWAHPRLVADPQVADFIPDLMRFELFEFDVYTGERIIDPGREVVDELSADLPVAFDGTVRIARFDHAVHRLLDVVENDDVPVAGSVGVLAYRDADNRYRQMDLTPLATSILTAMHVEQRTLADALRHACGEHQVDITAGVIEGTSQVLADLAERAALRGAWPTPDPDARDPSPHFRWLCCGPSL